MTKSILEVKQVTKIYKTDEIEVSAVDNVSFSIQSGEFVALVGPSGSGKTTMLALLATLLRASSGDLLIDGEELGAMNDSQRTEFRRKKIGFTFQSNNMVPYLNTLENVELMLRMNKLYNKESAKRAKALLERLGLGERLKNLPAQLSGGQQQRVAIARSLIHEPSVVLADEPTASLDTERANQVVQIFSELIHEGDRGGIMVTHDLRMCKYVDKVIQMVDGKIERIITDPTEIQILAGNSDSLHPVSRKVEEQSMSTAKTGQIAPNLLGSFASS